ncbi:MAG TPA: N-acyl homoserine lactonase family protein [Acidimicrobiales bacterium]|nr:N-acyl homoserine lactonase family protein [Acidimicrobiales bacterium]
MTASSGVRRIILLTLGWEELPKSWSVYGTPPEERLREPVPGVLLECDGGWMLLDTGFNPALIRDPALYRRFHGRNHDIQAILPGPGEPLEAAIDEVGLALEDIQAVAVSHLHNDHAGGLRHFADRVPIHAQRAELDYGLSDHPEPEHHGIFRVDFDDPGLDWRLADGDVEIAPGVTAVLTAGHTPGHQSFMVEIDESAGGGGYVFAFDAADLTENIEKELPVGGFINCEAADTVEPIRRLKALAAERGFQLVPGHDPEVWPATTAALAERWPSERPS